MTQQCQLPNGRSIDYLVSGAQDGFPFIFIHGTPGSSVVIPSFAAACGRKGIKLVTYNRSGYGSSTRNKGKKVVDEVEDIAGLKNHLGIQRCLIGGWSGGGPISIACAARLEGCIAALSIAACAPYNVEGLDWMAGQGQDNIDEFNATLAGPEALTTFLTGERSMMLSSNASGIVEGMSSILPEADKRVILMSEEMGQFMVDSFGEALREGVDGWFDDDINVLEPWGFELDEIKVPVLLYQGSEDKMVPFAHGQWLAEHIPKGVLRCHLEDGQGHISIVHDFADAMLDELLAIAKA